MQIYTKFASQEKEDATVSIDVLSMRKWNSNEHSIEIALPVFAIECEATPPISNHLDAYEEAVLKFVSIGLSTQGISKALVATESLIEEILDNLERKNYIQKKPENPWMLTEAGENYLNGIITDRESSSSQFGFMFVSAIKKDVLPYFYQGDLNKIPRHSGKLPEKLTVQGNEEETFDSISVKQSRLREAYKNYFKISEASNKYIEGDLSKDEAVDLAEDLFDNDEAFDDGQERDELLVKEIQTPSLKRNMFIRALNCPHKKVYLTIRIIIDPKVPGGYKVESPFDLNGVDDNLFLRQVQWLASSGNVFLGNKSLELLLLEEIQKLCPNYDENEIDYEVFVLERMPILKIKQLRFSRIYTKMSQIYSLMQRADDLMSKENIVSNISRYVVEALFNEFFRTISQEKRENIKDRAIEDIDYYGISQFKQNLLKDTLLEVKSIYWKKNYTINALVRLPYTKGNSIVEKYINLIAMNYYLGTEASRKFLNSNEVQKTYDLSDELNEIRKKVSHDTEEAFTESDYEYYMNNVFALINSLLEALKEN